MIIALALALVTVLVPLAPAAPLIGEWRSVGLQRPIHVSYRSVSNDSATVETWRTASGRETMTVYTREGERLIATHYCAQGNVASLAGPIGAMPMTFDFVAARGVDKGEGILIRLSIKVTGNRLRRTETYRTGGKDETDVIDFVRIASLGTRRPMGQAR